jgi:hypothetical protein
MTTYSIKSADRCVVKKMINNEHLVITAASQAFGPSVLALLGSINLNWPGHPPVWVYDLGMDRETLDILEENRIPVLPVPAFCPHWRKHFTWKIWCLNEAPAKHVLWIDAGMVVMAPLNEIFTATSTLGYFLAPNYQLLDWEASEAACKGCGVEPGFRLGKPTLAGGLMGFHKSGKPLQVLQEALSVALVEEHIRATTYRHRHDQAIISLLMYKHFGEVVPVDGQVYIGDKSPEQVPGQKVWVHRRGILPQDIDFYSRYISVNGPPRRPLNPSKNRPKNPFVLALRFTRSRLRRLKNRLSTPKIYDGRIDV